MKKLAATLWLLATTLFVPAAVAAEDLPALFQKLKAQVNGGSWADALTTLGTLQTEAAKPGQEQARDRLEGPINFYRGVCDANLGHAYEAIDDFVAFLRTQPGAVLDSKMYSVAVVTAFEKAREASADRPLTLEEAYKEFRPPKGPNESDPADKFWADGPVRWILTAEERTKWSELSGPNVREAFVEQFWASRSTLPGADGRSFREEFERRVAFADAYLVEGGEKRGSLTDRGMVFVLLGPPTYSSRQTLRGGEDRMLDGAASRLGSQEASIALKNTTVGAMKSGQVALLWSRYHAPENKAISIDELDQLEIWHYDRTLLPGGIPYPQVDIHYVTKRGQGANVMRRDPEVVNTLRAAANGATSVVVKRP